MLDPGLIPDVTVPIVAGLDGGVTNTSTSSPAQGLGGGVWKES
jgi:hypothetical protein